MLKIKDKADSKVSRVRVISKVKKVRGRDKVRVKVLVKIRTEVVTVVECRRKCKTTTTVISRLLMI